jgi:hypothetical protein
MLFSGRSQCQDRRQFNESTRVSDVRRFRARPSRFRRNAEGIGQRVQRNLVQGDERHGAQVQMVAKTEIIFTLVLVSDFFNNQYLASKRPPLSWACVVLKPQFFGFKTIKHGGTLKAFYPSNALFVNCFEIKIK